MKKIAIFSLLVLSLGGCASNQPRPYTVGGTTLGAGLGAIAGQAAGHNSKSTIIGAAAGAALGAIAGSIQDQTTTIQNNNPRYPQRPVYNSNYPYNTYNNQPYQQPQYQTYQQYQTYPQPVTPVY